MKRLRGLNKFQVSDIDKSEEYFSSPYFLSQEESRERKRRKYYANKIILEAQNVLKDNQLAAASCKLSSWARENAIKSAENHAKRKA